jgi:hypothetical protein
VKRVSELTPEQAEHRRQVRKEAYGRNREKQNEYNRNYRIAKANGALKKREYDAEDYAEEWKWLTEAGMLSADIIKQSTPSATWFKKHVTPLVRYANCPRCKRRFLVEKSGTLMACGKTCPGSSYTSTFTNRS